MLTQMLLTAYQGHLFVSSGDAGDVFEKRMQGRLDMRASATPANAQAMARKLIVCPCRTRYTLVTTTADSLLTRTIAAVQAQLPAVVGVLVGVVAAGALLVWRSRSRRA